MVENSLEDEESARTGGRFLSCWGVADEGCTMCGIFRSDPVIPAAEYEKSEEGSKQKGGFWHRSEVSARVL